MKTQTAVKVIQLEARFLGMSFVEVMKDIKEHGRMIYSERVVEAYKVVSND